MGPGRTTAAAAAAAAAVVALAHPGRRWLAAHAARTVHEHRPARQPRLHALQPGRKLGELTDGWAERLDTWRLEAADARLVHVAHVEQHRSRLGRGREPLVELGRRQVRRRLAQRYVFERYAQRHDLSDRTHAQLLEELGRRARAELPVDALSLRRAARVHRARVLSKCCRRPTQRSVESLRGDAQAATQVQPLAKGAVPVDLARLVGEWREVVEEEDRIVLTHLASMRAVEPPLRAGAALGVRRVLVAMFWKNNL